MIILSWVALCLRVLVAAIFIAYAVGKLRSPSSFAAAIRSHHLIPDSLSGIAAWILIVFEAALGLLLLFNVFPLIVGIAIGALLILFSGVLLRARFTPRLSIEDCGCSGSRSRKTTLGRALFRNALLVCVVAAVVITMSISRVIAPSLSILVEFAVLVCTLAGVICSQVQSLVSTRQAATIEAAQNRREGTSVSMLKNNRRSFIKWGVQFGVSAVIGVGFLWNRTSNVLAASPTPNIPIGPCPPNSACDCGPSGSGGWSGDCERSWNCSGNAGKYVPITVFCVVYCCGHAGESCEYYRYQDGEYLCPGGGGC